MINAPFKSESTGGSGSGETNTGANVGLGEGTVFRDKTGVTLNFKTLLEGDNITFVNGTDTIEINAVLPIIDEGEINTGANVGTGTGLIFRDKTSETLNFKSLVQGSNITLTNDANEITIAGPAPGETNTAANVGTGEEVYKEKVGAELRFRTLVAGTNITLTENTNDITINSTASGGGSQKWHSGVYIYGDNTVNLIFPAPFDLTVLSIKVYAQVSPTTTGAYTLTATGTGGDLVTAFDLTTLVSATVSNLTLNATYEDLDEDETLVLSFVSNNADLDAQGLYVTVLYEAR